MTTIKTILEFLLESEDYWESDAMYSFYELSDEICFEIFINMKNKQPTLLAPKIPPEQYQRALREFMTNGTFLRFPEKYLMKWKESIIRNILILKNVTDICGHSTQFPIDAFMDSMFDEDDPRHDERMSYTDASDYMEDNNLYDYLPTFSNGHYLISDYGLEPLMNLAHKLNHTNKPEEIIVTINKILDVAHQRSDLSELFIDGGQTTLTKISNDVDL